ncbi:MAG: hypothetical protein V1874_15240 [Spirochaetota bacterium]
MKINMNLDRLGSEAAPVKPARTDQKANNDINLAGENLSQAPDNLLKKRIDIDAIIVTQIAQGFFQKAVVISSKLKSLAADALATGKIKTAELNDTLKDISSLNKIQEGVSSPQSFSFRNNLNISQAGVTFDFVKTKEDLNALKEFAEDISSKTINLKKIDRINDSLINKADTVDNLSGQLINKFTESGNRISSVNNYSEHVQDTVGLILNYPQTALKSQGNISHNIAKNFL